MSVSIAVAIREASAVSEARRLAVERASTLGFSESRLSDVAIVTTELATNLIKHTPHGGELLIQSTDAAVLELLSLDRGPGIARVGEVMRDGYSTAGTPGTGLGAVSRLSNTHDVYTLAGMGTVVFAQLFAKHGALPANARIDAGTVRLPHPKERVSGDGWSLTASGAQVRLTVVDGLGHGLLANEAARAADRVFFDHPNLGPHAMLERIHEALRATRGAVGAMAELDIETGTLRFAGVGNISGVVLSLQGRRGLMSHNGTLGQEARKFQEYVLPWAAGDVLVMHTDGLASTWNLAKYPGLLRRRAAVIAGVLYRDFNRERDDVTVVVVKEREA
ncbi:ATP-binding SpoIIE family protein phosphatase [Deinococcus peraridilitoris]|uniref:Anti-sigma regulatory factor (Ser/Thr protein kinase) n=1 Tax=Deinococcus peraridilitoris (strain DSM 19664 / LMG 22246 / CIP 109416 / KR-200) TaxID=937777 RepID=K9ZWX1_DEIPD|nr:ATP-binding SpoIIE family protein phosphatase [Deinococcus peraridilitoris]AFZ66128.1 anti-sigma regulatory factor (Ser/Thr protein kinase) [Deinococcus peraridilitoris DSM 19664]